MSADDYLVIVKEGRKYTGYHCCASMTYKTIKAIKQCPIWFVAISLREAILLAQDGDHWTEYGYKFKGL